LLQGPQQARKHAAATRRAGRRHGLLGWMQGWMGWMGVSLSNNNGCVGYATHGLGHQYFFVMCGAAPLASATPAAATSAAAGACICAWGVCGCDWCQPAGMGFECTSARLEWNRQKHPEAIMRPRQRVHHTPIE
jgi:hypothetical protein